MIRGIFPILSSVFAAVGAVGLCWYYSLSLEEQERADKLANEYAKQLYQKSMDELNSHQLSDIQNRVRQQFES
jgi:2-polyprenyl-3-methyl-5-hydroxy-6-metoxy-1,4-benzoquinol methylase